MDDAQRRERLRKVEALYNHPGTSEERQAAAAAMVRMRGELEAKSTGAASDFSVGDRVFHQKYGNGSVTVVDGNKLTVEFDKAGEKRVVGSFVERE